MAGKYHANRSPNSVMSRLLASIASFCWLMSIQMIPASADSIAPRRLPHEAETLLVILHTNDFHGHVTAWQGWEGELAGRTIGGFDRLATAVKSVRQNAEHVLLLD